MGLMLSFKKLCLFKLINLRVNCLRYDFMRYIALYEMCYRLNDDNYDGDAGYYTTSTITNYP